jgi:hypothetical protein
MVMLMSNRRGFSNRTVVNSAPRMVLTPLDSLKKLEVPKFPVPITAEKELMKLAWTVACLPPTLPKFA